MSTMYIYLLLGRLGDLATILTATYKCVAGYVYAIHIKYHVGRKFDGVLILLKL